jgi:hypothetical protein
MPQIFEYHDLSTGRTHLFDVELLAKFCAAYMVPQRLAFAPDYRETLRVANDVDVARALRLPPEVLAVPPIMLETEPGMMIPCDGSHRLWRLLDIGGEVLCYVVPFDEALVLAEIEDTTEVREAMRPSLAYDRALHRLAAKSLFPAPK